MSNDLNKKQPEVGITSDDDGDMHVIRNEKLSLKKLRWEKLNLTSCFLRKSGKNKNIISKDVSE